MILHCGFWLKETGIKIIGKTNKWIEEYIMHHLYLLSSQKGDSNFFVQDVIKKFMKGDIKFSHRKLPESSNQFPFELLMKT